MPWCSASGRVSLDDKEKKPGVERSRTQYSLGALSRDNGPFVHGHVFPSDLASESKVLAQHLQQDIAPFDDMANEGESAAGKGQSTSKDQLG